MKSLKIIALILCVTILCAFVAACDDDNSTDSGKSPDGSSVTASSSGKGDSDIENTGTESINTESTSSADGSSSSGNEGSQVGNSSSNTDTSGEQDSTVSTPDESTALTVYVETKQEGNTVTAEVKIKNNPGLTAFNLGLFYNHETLSPNKVTKGLVSVTSNLQQSQNLSGKITLLYVDAEGFSDNGTLVTVTFDVKDSSKLLDDLRIGAEQNSFLSLDSKTYVTDFLLN